MVSAMMFSCDEAALHVPCWYMQQTSLSNHCLDVLVPLPGLRRCTSAGKPRNATACMFRAGRRNAVGRSGSGLQTFCPGMPRIFTAHAFPCSLCPYHSSLEDWTLVHSAHPTGALKPRRFLPHGASSYAVRMSECSTFLSQRAGRRC